jgi:uncharacterized SAM-binding protein YcdF (DUF218 family)
MTTTPPPSEAPEKSATRAAEPTGGGRSAPTARRKLDFHPWEIPLGAVFGGLVGLVVKDLDIPALASLHGPREPMVLAIALAVGILWAFGLRRTVASLAVAASALWCVVGFSPLCNALADNLVRREVPEAADAVFVSFAALSPAEPTAAESASRLLHAVELVARAKAPLLVVPGSWDGSTVTAAREMMERMSVPPDRLLATSPAYNTREEAVALGQLVRERGLKLVLVVTSPIHSRRLAASLIPQGVTIVVSPSLETRFDLQDLSRAHDRIGAFGSVIHELMGLWVYRLRGWL